MHYWQFYLFPFCRKLFFKTRNIGKYRKILLRNDRWVDKREDIYCVRQMDPLAFVHIALGLGLSAERSNLCFIHVSLRKFPIFFSFFAIFSQLFCFWHVFLNLNNPKAE